MTFYKFFISDRIGTHPFAIELLLFFGFININEDGIEIRNQENEREENRISITLMNDM